MTNEQKRQILEYMGYSIHVGIHMNRWNTVEAPNEWMYILEDITGIYDPDYDEIHLSKLIDIAWQHLEAREQAWQIEYIAHGTVRYIDIQAYPELVKLYHGISRKFEFMSYPQVMKMFYDG